MQRRTFLATTGAASRVAPAIQSTLPNEAPSVDQSFMHWWHLDFHPLLTKLKSLYGAKDPPLPMTLVNLAATHSGLRQADEARSAMARARRLNLLGGHLLTVRFEAARRGEVALRGGRPGARVSRTGSLRGRDARALEGELKLESTPRQVIDPD